jgi:hypothetical protein
MPQYDDGFLELPERGWRRYKVSQGHSTRPVTPTLLAVATLCDDRESGEGRTGMCCHLAALGTAKWLPDQNTGETYLFG